MTILVGLALVACGGSVPGQDDAGSGGESGHLLRFDASDGDSMRARMTIDMAMRITVGEQEAPRVDIPTFETTMDMTVDDVGEQIDSSFTYRDVQTAGGDPQVRQQMQQAVAGMEGMAGTVSLTPRGELANSRSPSRKSRWRWVGRGRPPPPSRSLGSPRRSMRTTPCVSSRAAGT